MLKALGCQTLVCRQGKSNPPNIATSRISHIAYLLASCRPASEQCEASDVCFKWTVKLRPLRTLTVAASLQLSTSCVQGQEKDIQLTRRTHFYTYTYSVHLHAMLPCQSSGQCLKHPCTLQDGTASKRIYCAPIPIAAASCISNRLKLFFFYETRIRCRRRSGVF